MSTTRENTLDNQTEDVKEFISLLKDLDYGEKREIKKRRRSKMKTILLRMKKIYNHEAWLKMVEQAKERGKLTDEEYQELVSMDETEEE